MRKNVPASPGAPRLKSQDDAEFLHRWIAFGKALKAKADGYGIDWARMSFEEWQSAITFAEEWSKGPQEVLE